MAPNRAHRLQIVPEPETTGIGAEEASGHVFAGDGSSGNHPLSWAKPLAWIFRIDVTNRPDYDGPMPVIAALTEQASITRCLKAFEISWRAPTTAPERSAPQAASAKVT